MSEQGETIDCLDGMISQMQRAIPKNDQHKYGVFAKEIDHLHHSLENKVDELYHNILNNFNRTTTVNPLRQRELDDIAECQRTWGRGVKTSKSAKENVFELVSRRMILNSGSYKNIHEGVVCSENMFKVGKRREKEEQNKGRNVKLNLGKMGEKRDLKKEQLENHLLAQKEINGVEKPRKQIEITAKFSISDCKFQEQYQEIEEICRIQTPKRKKFKQMIKWIQQKCKSFNIKNGLINSKKLISLFQNCPFPIKSDFLNLFQNQLPVKQTKVLLSLYQNQKQKQKGIIDIQKVIRNFLERKRLQRLKLQNDSVVKIQQFWHGRKRLQNTRTEIKTKNTLIYEKYKELQNNFRKNWSSIKYQNRVQIHIANSQFDDFQKLSTQNIKQLQNTLITRIFRSQDPYITVIYVSPLVISSEIIAYYRKIMEMTKTNSCRFHFVTPEIQVSLQESLMESLMNSPKCLRRIRDIVGSRVGYIVPGQAAMGYAKLAVELNTPVYGCVEESRYFELTSSIPRLATPAHSLPSCYDLFSLSDLYTSLSSLIYSHPKTPRWYLKIDDSRKSKGIAYFDTHSFFEFHNIEDKITHANKDTVTNYLSIILHQKLKYKLKIVSNNVYRSYEEYMKKFLGKGGYVEASANQCKEGESRNRSVMVEIEPDSEWKVISSYGKIIVKHKSIGYEFIQSIPDALNNLVRQITEQTIIKKFNYFGFIVFDFLQKHESQYYLIGIDSYLNQAISSFYMSSLFTSSSQPLFVYCPMIFQRGIRDLQFKTFFQFCRLEGISFDINHHSGSIFTFMDSLQSSCLGLISISNTRKQVYRLINKTIQFIIKNVKKQQHISVLRNDVEITLEDISHKMRIIEKRLSGKEMNQKNLIPLN